MADESDPWSSLLRSLRLRQLQQRVSSLQQWFMAFVALGWKAVDPVAFMGFLNLISFLSLMSPHPPSWRKPFGLEEMAAQKSPPTLYPECVRAFLERFYCFHCSVNVRVSSELCVS